MFFYPKLACHELSYGIGKSLPDKLKTIMEDVISVLKRITILLSEIKESQSIFQLEQKSVWTVSDFAAYTGYTVDSVYQLTNQCKIPHHKPNGKFVFFERDEVIAWLLRNPVKEEDAVVIDLLSSKSRRR